MRAMRALIIVLMFLAAQSAYAASLKDISKTKSLSNKTMQHFLKAAFVEGLNIAKAYWPLPAVEIDALAQMKLPAVPLRRDGVSQINRAEANPPSLFELRRGSPRHSSL